MMAWFAAVVAGAMSWPVGLPFASSTTPGEPGPSPSAVSAAWFTRAPAKPPPWIQSGLAGAAALSSANVKRVGLSSCGRLHPPWVVQIHFPSGSSTALAAYMASAVERLVTRSSRTTCVQQW